MRKALVIHTDKVTGEYERFEVYPLNENLTMEKVQERAKAEPIETFKKALTNATPLIEVKARRIGGSTYQVPIEVKADRGQALGSCWIIEAARKRGGKSMVEKLTNEIMDSSNGIGAACKKREDTHKMAEANKAFAHYRY